MRLPLILSLALLCFGCTVISNDRVFPGLAWAWSPEAKRQRESDKRHKEDQHWFEVTNGWSEVQDPPAKPLNHRLETPKSKSAASAGD